MMTYEEVNELWKEKQWQSYSYWQTVGSVPTDMTCYHGEHTADDWHRQILIYRATNDPLHQQLWSFELDDLWKEWMSFQKAAKKAGKPLGSLYTIARILQAGEKRDSSP